MKKLKISFISEDVPNKDLVRVSGLLDLQEKHAIDNLLWSSNGYVPAACFAIAYRQNSILLKYAVKEKYHKAICKKINDPVYNDSCVEFFIAFDNEDLYYNLEFNYLGTVLGGYGTGKSGRTAIKEALLAKIRNHHLITLTGDAPGKNIYWELTLDIPFEVFEHHHITALENLVCSVNFYKCGDKLPEPHFLSWKNIISPSPNFHLPVFFGKAEFI